MKSLKRWLAKAGPAEKPEGSPCEKGATRRTLFHKIGVGSLLSGIAGLCYAMMRPLVPDVLYEQARRFKAGAPDSFPEEPRFSRTSGCSSSGGTRHFTPFRRCARIWAAR